MFLYLFLCFAHSVQVKPRKKTKKDKPAQTPVVTEPEQDIAAPAAFPTPFLSDHKSHFPCFLLPSFLAKL